MKKGVFLCHCGNNISEKIDIDFLKEKLEIEGYDVYDSLFLCSKDARELIIESINDLDGVVIGACSPEIHESYFSEYIKKPFVIVNLREQCSWPHLDRKKATEKAFSLIKSGLEKVSALKFPKVKEFRIEKSVAVIGGGIAGITASLELARMGYEVHLIEKLPSIGGKMLKLDKIYPLNDCASCLVSSLISEVAENRNIRLHVYTEVEGVKGCPGNFKLLLRKKQTFVDWDKCTGCGRCVEACPDRAKVPDEFNEGLTFRKAMYIYSPFSYPKKAVHDPKACLNCGKKKIGSRRLLRDGKEYKTPCEIACPTGAIDRSKKWDPEGEFYEIDVGAIILATGYNVMEKYRFAEFPSDSPNIITGLQMERILSSTGPTNGQILIPDTNKKPRVISFISCVGSRDRRYHTYCSKVCCMYMLKQARLVKERNPEIDVIIHYIDVRAPGRDLEEYYTLSRKMGVKILRGRVGGIERLRDGRLRIMGFDSDTGDPVEYTADLVVLATAVEIGEQERRLARMLRVNVDSSGFIKEKHPKLKTYETSIDGVYLAGCVQGPKDVTETVLQAKSAALKAINFIATGKRKVEIEVDVNYEKCTGCYICLRSCPYKAIIAENGSVTINEVACRNCGICFSVCPAGAIEMARYGLSVERELEGLKT